MTTLHFKLVQKIKFVLQNVLVYSLYVNKFIHHGYDIITGHQCRHQNTANTVCNTVMYSLALASGLAVVCKHCLLAGAYVYNNDDMTFLFPRVIFAAYFSASEFNVVVIFIIRLAPYAVLQGLNINTTHSLLRVVFL